MFRRTMRLSRLAPLVLLLVGALPAAGQGVVSGRVTDAQSGAPLPAATVQIEGTYTGTITNGEGRYELRVPERPATLVVRFIGFETQRRAVEAGDATLDVALTPAVLQSPEVVVTDENPAEVIMRRVIEAKRRWQAGLETWRADAYVRQVLGRDTSIVGIVEGVTEAYWRRGDGVREVVRGVRKTDNFTELQPEFFRAADAVLNFYDDELEFAGYDLMGPTSDDALDFYAFTLDGTRTLDDEIVYDIGLRPKNRLQPGFEGRVSVLGGVYALIDVALRPNASVRFPLVTAFDLTLAQQFSSFPGVAGEAVWLPVDFRLGGEGRIGMTGLQFPTMTFRIVARLTDYDINVPVPDSLYEAEMHAVVDSAAVAADTVLDRSGAVVPLEPREAVAFATIDSTDTFEKAYKPSGFLARFVDMEDDGEDTGDAGGRSRGWSLPLDVTPQLWYNRVEAAHLGAEVGLDVGRVADVEGALGYSTGLETLTYDGRVSTTLRLGDRDRLTFAAGVRREIAPRVPSVAYGRIVNSVAVLVGEPDYFDYYRREGATASVSARLRRLRTRVTAFGLAEQHRAVRQTTGFDLLGRDLALALNPAIPEGDLRSLGAEVTVGAMGEGIGAALTGTRGLRLRVEVADGALGSDFDFVRAEGVFEWRVPTFLRRRLFPNTLDLRLAGGVSGGELPLQRHFGIDGTVLGYAPHGVFRSRRDRPLEGDRYAAVSWEHDFRSVPFELLGLEALAVRNVGLSVHGAHGRTWIRAFDDLPPGYYVTTLRYDPGWVHELGVSLHGGFVLPVRLDLTYRLDDPGLFFSFGVARLF